MAEHDGAAGQCPPDAVPEVGAQNEYENTELNQPFFSMCQPLRSVSYSDSWEGFCAPAVNDNGHNSDLKSMADESMLTASCSPGKQEPQTESISNLVGGESKLWSPHLIDNEASLMQDGMGIEQSVDDFDVPDVETNQQPEPISTEQPSSNDEMELWCVEADQQLVPLNNEQCNTNIGIDSCNMEDENFPFSFSYRRQPQSVGAGLRNMGNTCFLNATLQCITHTVPLVLKLRSTHHSTPCSYNKDGFCSFCALKEHSKESIRRSGSVIMPTKFRDNLKKLSSDFRQGQQEDAHEFLRCLLDNLHKCTLDPDSKGKGSSFSEESMVKHVFGGQLKSKLSCCECGHSSETFEPFLDLNLEINQVDHLVDALESFTKVEQVGDSEEKLTCEHCKAQVCKNKQLTLDKTPDVIALQLKRFTTLDNSIEKIDKHVVYPPELDLKPFHSDPDTAEELKYDLYGIVEHSGILPNYGHYVCTIRSSPSTWHLMNDSHVDSITSTNALNQEAYILFYVRQGKFPWFSSLLEDKDAQHDETTRGASPVSVLENIDANCSTSPGEVGNGSSGDRSEKNETRQCNTLEQDETSQYNVLEKDETTQCKSSFLPGEPSKESLVGASNSNAFGDEISPCRAHLQCDIPVRYSGSVETNLDRPSTPRPKRPLPNNDLGVFEFEDFDDEDTPLLPELKFKPMGKKGKAASASKATKALCFDVNATRLMRSMPSKRRQGFLDCMPTLDNAKRSCPASEPLHKKKRKLVSQY